MYALRTCGHKPNAYLVDVQHPLGPTPSSSLVQAEFFKILDRAPSISDFGFDYAEPPLDIYQRKPSMHKN